MKINQIIVETATTAGSVATVSKPLGEVQARTKVAGLEPAEKVMKGSTKKKGPYANSLSEGKVKELSMDLSAGKDGLSDIEFKKKYGKTKQEIRKAMQNKPQKTEPVKEAKLDEEDKIIAVGKGHKLKPGLLSKPENSMNPTDIVKLDVPLLIRLLEFAREDASTDMDLHDLAEKLVARGSRGKILSMKDYEYVIDEAMTGAGVIGSGMSYESQQFPDNSNSLAKRSISQAERPNAPKTASGHPTVANRFHGKAAQTRVEPTITSTKVKRKDSDRPIPSFLQKEGAKVDRMVKHIEKSEEKAGKSKKEAENIAWATANKRGMLDNKNKKK